MVKIKKRNVDNPFFEFMGNLADIVMLNIVFLITCIPVITIGTGMAALNKIMLRRHRDECVYPVKEYFEEFRREWKQGWLNGLIFLVTGAILLVDILYIGKSWNFWGIGIGVLIAIWAMLATYVFPVQAQFENSIRNIWKNSMYMAVRHFPYTILMVLLNAIPVFVFLTGETLVQLVLPIYLVIGFALTTRINAIFFHRIFSKYM